MQSMCAEEHQSYRCQLNYEHSEYYPRCTHLLMPVRDCRNAILKIVAVNTSKTAQRANATDKCHCIIVHE